MTLTCMFNNRRISTVSVNTVTTALSDPPPPPPAPLWCRRRVSPLTAAPGPAPPTSGPLPGVGEGVVDMVPPRWCWPRLRVGSRGADSCCWVCGFSGGHCITVIHLSSTWKLFINIKILYKTKNLIYLNTLTLWHRHIMTYVQTELLKISDPKIFRT